MKTTYIKFLLVFMVSGCVEPIQIGDCYANEIYKKIHAEYPAIIKIEDIGENKVLWRFHLLPPIGWDDLLHESYQESIVSSFPFKVMCPNE